MEIKSDGFGGRATLRKRVINVRQTGKMEREGEREKSFMNTKHNESSLHHSPMTIKRPEP
jgi:hypothetical protein